MTPTAQPSPLDLTTLQACKNWINLTGPVGAADSALQRCLTAWSVNFLRMTGRGPRNWQTATQSPYNQPVDYSEVYDGNGNNRLMTRNFPVNSVASLSIFGSVVSQQTAPGGAGWVINNTGRSVDLVNNAIGGNGFTLFTAGPSFPISNQRGGYPNGVQNVSLVYNAGFNTVPVVGALYPVIAAWAANTAYSTGSVVSDGTFLQYAVASGTSGALAPAWASTKDGSTPDGAGALVWLNTGVAVAPNTIQVFSDVAILADGGVSYFSSGTALTKVSISPAAGQYVYLGPGLYLFNVADAGQQMLVSYTAAGTPTDIVEASVEAVALNYKRKDWIGIISISQKDIGQTTYTQFSMSKSVQDVVRNYTRASLQG